MDLHQLITELPAQLNIPLLIALMAGGYIIKHVPAMKKVSNNLIPIILPVCAVIVSLLLGDISSAEGIVTAIISGLINAAMAVWTHESGKNIFEMINAKTIKEVLSSVTEEENKEE